MHYKAPDNSLHFLDDDSFLYLLPPGSIAITDSEAASLEPKNSPKTTAERVAAELDKVGETRTSVRTIIQLSELIAKIEGAKLGMTNEAAIAYAYSKNVTYRRARDTEAECLRIEAGGA